MGVPIFQAGCLFFFVTPDQFFLQRILVPKSPPDLVHFLQFALSHMSNHLLHGISATKMYRYGCFFFLLHSSFIVHVPVCKINKLCRDIRYFIIPRTVLSTFGCQKCTARYNFCSVQFSSDRMLSQGLW